MGERPAEAASAGQEPQKTFAREATGLVREISFFDHLMTNMNGVVPLAALALTPWWIWFAVPGGDPLLATVGGFLLSVVGSIVSYAVISATFPRSAAPYVANSRVLHPAIGWPVEFLMWLGWILALALYPSFMLTWGIVPGLYTMGISTGNQALVNAAVTVTQPIWVLLIGTVFFLIALGVAVTGTKRLVRTLQLPMTIIMFIAIIVIVAYWRLQARPACTRSFRSIWDRTTLRSRHLPTATMPALPHHTASLYSLSSFRSDSPPAPSTPTGIRGRRGR